MQLTSIKVDNFRCLNNLSLPMHKLTVLIGENDSGKSSILDLLEIVLNNSQPDSDDFCRRLVSDDEDECSEETAEQIEVTLVFEIDDSDTIDPAMVAPDGKFYLRKILTPSTTETYCKAMKCQDDRLEQNFARLTVSEIDQLLAAFNITYEGHPNKDAKVELLARYKGTAPTVEDWISVSSTRIRDILPRFERYKTIDYQTPESLVQKTLRTVYESTIYEQAADGQPQLLIKPLREVIDIAQQEINKKVGELLAFVQRYVPQAQEIEYEPTIDFLSGLKLGEFRLSEGRGFHPLSKKGDGTKRRMLMAIFDWDRQVQAEQANTARSVIRGYDEPDTNLHYEAQRRVYRTISEIVNCESSRIQAIICTHALTLIDRAPAKGINLLKLTDGVTQVDYLKTDGDGEVEEFLNLLAGQLGITNTMLFYERCYILVEGATEEFALPLLYGRLYNRSLLDDGIRVVNIGGHGAWLPFLKLLSKNRQHITLSLLDTDAQAESSQKYRNAGFCSDDFWEHQCYWAGTKEFEDTFSDEVWCLCLENAWSRRDGFAWSIDDLQPLRVQANRRNRVRDKFSEQLVSLVRNETKSGTFCTKPDLGRELGKHCPLDQIPEIYTSLFGHAQRISGVVQT